MNQTKGAIVLAAGFSTRFGGRKLLAPLKNEQTVFQQTSSNIAAAIDQQTVITRPELHEALQQLAPHARVLSFEGASEGMGSTLAYGIQQISDWDGCLICLADMPFIQPSSYSLLAQQLTAESIIIPTFEGKSGNPVAFDQHFFPALAKLSGETGGRAIIKQHDTAVQRLALNDPGIVQDIDTPGELDKYQN